MECMIVGDSIAVGISNFRQECHVNAAIGRRASQQGSVGYAGRALIISVGSNDGSSLSERELRRIRESARASYVFWVLPNRPEHARQLVMQVARSYSDQTVDMRAHASQDGIHPTWLGYQALAHATRR